eukprot:scaffold7077_cov122-Skeletonema_dohrnii-CCMP3373.AAC.3
MAIARLFVLLLLAINLTTFFFSTTPVSVQLQNNQFEDDGPFRGFPKPFTLRSGDPTNNSIMSPDGQYKLVMESTGNLVLYNMTVGQVQMWQSSTLGTRGVAYFAADGYLNGNLVVEAEDHPCPGDITRWTSGTSLADGIGGQGIVLYLPGPSSECELTQYMCIIVQATGSDAKTSYYAVADGKPFETSEGILRRTILDKVYGGGDDSTFDGPSAAFDAINWLYDDCNNCGQFCSGNQVVQRYILAVFYFSTNFNGENSWMRCSAPNNLQSNETCWVQSSYGSNITYSQGPGSALGSRGFRWLTCNNECEWGGTHCNENGLINATDFVKNNLTGTLPPEVGALPELSVLRLVRSTFSGTIPSSYSDLTELTILDLSNNWGLSGNLIDMSKMTKLQELSLHQNRLGGYIEELGWEKTNLQVINLSYNNFVGFIPDKIFENPNLSELY